MTAPTCGGRGSFLETKGRAQSGAGASGRVHSEHAQTKMGHVRRRRERAKRSCQPRGAAWAKTLP